MGTRKSRLIIYTLMFLLSLASASPLGIWTKTKDTYLMSCIDLEPTGSGELISWNVLDVDKDCLSKMIMLENTGEISKITDYEKYVEDHSYTIEIPFTIDKSITSKLDTITTTFINLEELLEKRIYTTYSSSYNIVTIGLASEEWELIYFQNITIGVCNSGDWSLYSNCTPSSNFTIQEKQIYANITSNETLWKINGTFPNYNILQLWTSIHENAYDIDFSFSDLYNYTNTNLTNYPLASASSLSITEEIDFESGVDNANPEDWDVSVGSYITKISEDVAHGDNKSLLIQNTLTDSRPALIYDTTFNFTVDSTIVHSIYLDKMGDIEVVYNYGDTIVSNILTFQIDKATRILEWYNQSSSAWVVGITPLKFQDWSKVHVNLDFTNDFYDIYVDGIFQGSGEFRNYDHDASSFSKIQIIFNEDANETHLYFDNWEMYDQVYLPSQLETIANNSYEILWTTGWAYCTDHVNCTEEFYCDTSGLLQNYQCVNDLVPTIEILNTRYYLNGEITLFGTMSYGGNFIEKATGNFSIGHANGTFIDTYPAIWNNITEYYEHTLNLSDVQLSINLTLEKQANFTSASDTNHLLDVLDLGVEITYPDEFSNIYASTIYPTLILTLTEAYFNGECRWILNYEPTNWFLVTNNISYDNIPLKLINNVNYLEAECRIGGIYISKDVTFKTLSIPDPFLFGINLNVHIFVEEGLFEIKGFLNEFGLIYLFFMTPLSILMAVMYLFIKLMRTAVGGKKNE